MQRVVLFLAACCLAHGDTLINGNRAILGRWDASAAASVKPVKTGTSLPATCETGEVYFKTDAPANRKLHMCGPANVWTQESYAQGTTSARPSTCDTGQLFFATDAAAGKNLYLCNPANTWTQVNGSGGTSTFGVSLDGGGAAIAAGQKGYVTIPYACAITGWSMQADQPGSIAIEIDKKASAIPAVSTDSIVGAAPPALSSAQLRMGTCAGGDCSGWNTSIAANDVIGFSATSATAITRATLVVNCQR